MAAFPFSRMAECPYTSFVKYRFDSPTGAVLLQYQLRRETLAIAVGHEIATGGTRQFGDWVIGMGY